MKNYFIIIFCLVLAPLAYADEFKVFTGQVNADKINMRVDATTGSEVISVLSKGQKLDVVSQVYDWYKVRLPENAPSYVKKGLVECITSDNVQSVSGKCLSAKVVKDRINIRLQPSESSWILGKADKLTIINVLSDEGQWYKIQPIYKSYGWINKRFLDKAPELPAKIEAPVLPKTETLPDQLAIKGTVKPYGMVLWRKATHKLITADNKIYLLKGNRKSLNALNYHQVKVTGKLITPPNTKYPIIEIDIIEAL